MLTIKHWQVTWFSQSVRDRHRAEFPDSKMDRVGYAICHGFKTREDAEQCGREHVADCQQDWCFDRRGDTRIDSIDEITEDFDDEKLIAEMRAIKDTADWGVFLLEPGDVFGDLYEECAKQAGVQIEWYSTNGDQRAKLTKCR